MIEPVLPASGTVPGERPAIRPARLLLAVPHRFFFLTGVIQIAAGWYHTAGTKPDGTAVAVGANWWDMCNVSSWANITQVAAGAYHTVGVKSDGTVVAAGANEPFPVADGWLVGGDTPTAAR